MVSCRKVTSLFLALLGLVGILACAAAIAGTWTLRNQLDSAIGETLDRVDTALGRVQELAEETNERVGNVRSTLELVDHRVQARIAELQDISEEEAADIDEIERQLYVRVQHVKNWIDFMRSSVELVEQMLAMAESTSAFLQADSRSAWELIATLRSGQEEVQHAAALVDEVRTALVEIRASRNFDENARRVNTLSSRIEASLTKIEGYGDQFESGVVQSRADAIDLGERIRERLLLLAIGLTVFLAWMAIGQLCLVFQCPCFARDHVCAD